MANLPKQFADMINYAYKRRNELFIPWVSDTTVIHKNEEARIWHDVTSEICLASCDRWQKTNPFTDKQKYSLSNIMQLDQYLQQQKESQTDVSRLSAQLFELDNQKPMFDYIAAVMIKKLPLMDKTTHVDAIFIHCKLVVGSMIARWRLSGTSEDKSRGIQLDEFVRATMDITLQIRLKRFDAPDGEVYNFCQIVMDPRRSDREYLIILIKFARNLAKPITQQITLQPDTKKAEEVKQVTTTHDIILSLNRNSRSVIDDICKVHHIKCIKSVTKASLVAAIAAKLGDDALDPIKLYTPPILADVTKTCI